MDDQRLGSLLRALRIKRGLRQIDVAQLAGVSDQTISRLERGDLTSLSVSILRRVTRVLEARLDLRVWTRAGEIERIANAPHAALVESVIAHLARLGWSARPEVSFSISAERGLVDVLAWQAETRTVLVIEVKTEIVDVAELVGTLDRKRRLGPVIARQCGWSPRTCSTALVVADSTTNHRRIQAYRATFRAALPDGGQRLRAFLRRPSGTIAAVAFWSIRHPGSARSLPGGVRRVRRRERAGTMPWARTNATVAAARSTHERRQVPRPDA